MRYHVESYGCTMNQGEGRQLSERMAALGHEETADVGDADVVLLNTCTVIETTEKKMLRRLADLESMGKQVVVTGCMAKAQPLAIRGISSQSLVLPPEDYISFSDVISTSFGTGAVPEGRSYEVTEILPIAQGCKGRCSYCITRLARGELRSHPIDDLISAFKRMIEGGAKEVLLSAQDTGCYGWDAGTDLPTLINGMLDVPGDYRIRIGMMNPDSAMAILPDLIATMRDDRVYRFLHLPLQSGSDDVLRGMRRKYTVGDFFTVVDALRGEFQTLSLATDIITGFPGEGDDDHAMTVDALKRLHPDTVNVTRFSPRPGTAASFLSDIPHGRVSKARSREITGLRFDVAGEVNRQREGEEPSVLATEKGKNGTTICRTDDYRPVIVDGDIPMGRRLTVTITSSAPTHLYGRPSDLPILNN